jgi:hypothetical protein
MTWIESREAITAIPLLPLATLGPVVVGVPILLRSRRISEVLDAMPVSWIIALQVFRVLGSAFLITGLTARCRAFFRAASIGDIFTGLLRAYALFWLVLLTALWIALNCALPVIGASGAPIGAGSERGSPHSRGAQATA